ncbi:RCC1 domain-containing protein [Methanocella conradii]|uniref:RCC1 domain-containing protein n=1 Tax=Methanocella conradii TaxID=1175444 RepID=UPI0024B39B8F|nr:RCC1 domain-containing protein [Methanocella conradii]MDI6897871.1 chromosome condensation regulator RCC1 [Methanocella conradii]
MRYDRLSYITLFITLYLIIIVPCNASSSKVVAVAAYGSTSLAMMDTGTVWAWGDNYLGYIKNNMPQKIDVSDAKAITAGYSHILILKNDGTVWAWGYNNEGQLGDGTSLTRAEPVQVTGLTNVQAIASGFAHNLALKDDGTVWAWGYNIYGQLGVGNCSHDIPSPIQIVSLSNVTAISTGDSTSFALKDDGSVWAWGENDHGQIGDGTNENKLIPIKVPINDIIDIASCGGHTLALKDDGTVLAWGRNCNGELGNGGISEPSNKSDRYQPDEIKGLSDVIAISAGQSHSVALKKDGSVWVWGENQEGILGLGTVSGYDKNAPVLVTRLRDIIAISAGSRHTLALKNDGTVWAWGNNRDGAVGVGVPQQYVSIPTMVIGDKPFDNGSTIVITPIITPNSTTENGYATPLEQNNGFNYLGIIGLLCLIAMVCFVISILKRK